VTGRAQQAVVPGRTSWKLQDAGLNKSDEDRRTGTPVSISQRPTSEERHNFTTSMSMSMAAEQPHARRPCPVSSRINAPFKAQTPTQVMRSASGSTLGGAKVTKCATPLVVMRSVSPESRSSTFAGSSLTCASELVGAMKNVTPASSVPCGSPLGSPLPCSRISRGIHNTSPERSKISGSFVVPTPSDQPPLSPAVRRNEIRGMPLRSTLPASLATLHNGNRREVG